jgi:hypothetical protein
MYPMKADIYFPILTQGDYGQPKKDWVYDRTIICNATPVGGLGNEDIKPEAFLQYENKLIVRTKNDPRVSSNNANNAITNILVTNIRDAGDVVIYRETAGPRSGRGTIYEVATVEPFTGPFGSVEYYKMLWRRTENQTVGD